MAEREDQEKRIKFCRYCDGVIEWGIEACPHCGESLELVSFDEMDFIPTERKAERGRGLSGAPPRPRPKGSRRPDLTPLPPEEGGPPVVKPIDAGGPPVVKPIGPAGGDEPPVVKPLSPPAKGPPVVKPIGSGPGKPPVVKPIGGKGGSPPVVKPIGGGPARPPVVKPIGGKGGKPPVVKPIGGGPAKPPVVKPIGPGPTGKAGAGRRPKGPPVVKPLGPSGTGEPPVVKPLASGPPVLEPLGKGGPPVMKPIPGDSLPSGVGEMRDCPVCEAELETAEDVGGICGACGQSVCVACLMRANGVRVTASSDRNAERWREHAATTSADQVRCPACGQTGVR